MKVQDEIAAANEQLWARLVKEGCGYTIPWLNLDPIVLRQYAAGRLETAPDSLIDIYPLSILADVGGKDVLCLASGGGQQSAVFGLLGARVTVVDLAQGQLDGDRQAADHYGYEITTLKGDMRDLAGLSDASFDLAYQADSVGYVPDVRPVYSEVARVLKSGGVYRVTFQQPAVFSVEWNGEAYRIAKPYAQRIHRREDGGIEFRHYLSDIFNGLFEVGFAIEQVYEEPYYEQQNAESQPGSWAHQQTFVSGGFAIVAKKR